MLVVRVIFQVTGLGVRVMVWVPVGGVMVNVPVGEGVTIPGRGVQVGALVRAARVSSWG